MERGFGSHVTCVDRKETDHFDAQALHGVVRHRETGLTVATVRLVRGQTEVPDSLFPLEEAYPDLLLQHGLTDQVLPRWSTAEISRFAISRSWQRYMRRQRGQQASALARAGWHYNGRCYPLVTFGLFVALMRLSAQNGITHWLAVMEPSLLRLLARFGIGFDSIGGVVDYHGRRQPCYGRVDDINDCVRGTECNLFDLVQYDLTSIHPNSHCPVVQARRHVWNAVDFHSAPNADKRLAS